MSAAQLAFDVDDLAGALLAEAREWRLENPAAYGAIVAWAQEDAARSGRCAMQRYMEALRDPASARMLFVHRADALYLVNHNLRSALTRLILAEHPSLPFHIRKSSCDAQGTHATPSARGRGNEHQAADRGGVGLKAHVLPEATS